MMMLSCCSKAIVLCSSERLDRTAFNLSVKFILCLFDEHVFVFLVFILLSFAYRSTDRTTVFGLGK